MATGYLPDDVVDGAAGPGVAPAAVTSGVAVGGLPLPGPGALRDLGGLGAALAVVRLRPPGLDASMVTVSRTTTAPDDIRTLDARSVINGARYREYHAAMELMEAAGFAGPILGPHNVGWCGRFMLENGGNARSPMSCGYNAKELPHEASVAADRRKSCEECQLAKPKAKSGAKDNT